MTDQIFDHSIGIILDIKIWSGSKNLKSEDFKGIELPPDELISLGSKRLHNKDTLKPIQAVRTRAVTFMESNGVSLYGGKIWLVPADKLGEVQSLLSDFATMFETEKNNFLADFYTAQRDWLNQNVKWAGILEPYLDTPETVEKKFGFTWRTFRIGAATDDALAETVTGDVTCVLLKEVSTLAGEAYETLKDKDRATPKNLNRLDRLVIKLQGLAFVNPGVGVIQHELSQILEAKDAHGAMSGGDVFKLSRLLVQLKNPAVLGEILDAASNGDCYQFVYEDEAPTMPPPVFANPKHQPRLPEAWF
jgi:hypothetical protein